MSEVLCALVQGRNATRLRKCNRFVMLLLMAWRNDLVEAPEQFGSWLLLVLKLYPGLLLLVNAKHQILCVYTFVMAAKVPLHLSA